jgi:hypothetical protein
MFLYGACRRAQGETLAAGETLDPTPIGEIIPNAFACGSLPSLILPGRP